MLEEEKEEENTRLKANIQEDMHQRYLWQKEEVEQCLRWVRDQLRALRHTNRIYEKRIIGGMATNAGASTGGSI